MDGIAYTNSLWVVEHINKSNGKDIRWHDKVRLLSLAAKKYLCIYSEDGQDPYFYLDDLDEHSADISLFNFISPNAIKIDAAIKSNDYISIRTDFGKYYLGTRPIEPNVLYEIKALNNHKDENTFKLMKSDKFSNQISYFSMSTYKCLSDLL